jgi:hypothetical protein
MRAAAHLNLRGDLIRIVDSYASLLVLLLANFFLLELVDDPRWGAIGSTLLAAVALVVGLVVLPLLNLGGAPGGGTSPQASPSATEAATAEPGTVLVPQTVGLSTADAIEAANEAGLEWTIRCNEDPAQPEGIIAQEPPADTPVAPGSTFTMFSARVSDCR